MLERADLETVAAHYLRSVADAAPMVPTIVQFYLQARHLAQESLLDGGGQKPHYSLRTLCRALRYAKELVPLGEYNRVSVSMLAAAHATPSRHPLHRLSAAACPV